MGRARDISKVFSTGTALATDTEVSAFNYLTQSSASTVYQTKATAGLTLLTPGSITNTGGTASIGANGTVTFSGVASQAVNNVFSASYRNYKILFDLTSNVSDSSIYMKLRVGGVNNSTNYNWAMPGLSNTGVNSPESAQSQTVGWVITYVDNVGNDGLSSASIDLFKPFLANNTTAHIVMSNVSFSSVLRGNAGALVHEETISYDGIDVISSSGNISGSISIYGYNS